ncbi:hypothetical protein QOT17_016422 [Balamuthia mandrillaris]
MTNMPTRGRVRLFVLVVLLGVVFSGQTQAQTSCGGEARITETIVLRSDCSGSHASGLVDQQTVTSYIVASGKGAHAFGHAVDGYLAANYDGTFVAGYANDGRIVAADAGAFALGYALTSSEIVSSGDGSFALGYASDNSSISAAGQGAFAFGHAQDSARIASTDTGSIAAGLARDGRIIADAEGAIALGYVPCYTIIAASNGEIRASSDASFAWGYAEDGLILASDTGAIALGTVGSYGRVISEDNGSFALGNGEQKNKDKTYLTNHMHNAADTNATIEASGDGAFAMGFGEWRVIMSAVCFVLYLYVE